MIPIQLLVVVVLQNACQMGSYGLCHLFFLLSLRLHTLKFVDLFQKIVVIKSIPHCLLLVDFLNIDAIAVTNHGAPLANALLVVGGRAGRVVLLSSCYAAVLLRIIHLRLQDRHG